MYLINIFGNYQCPCCKHFTLSVPADYEICPVCYWEDDPYQYENPEYGGGANALSLISSQKNYNDFGAVEMEFISNVRKPNKEEMLQLMFI